MHSIKGTKTEANLIAAFNGETQANTKYTLFATKARNDGYNEIANIFEQTAKNELAHARLWYKYLHSDEMPDTQTNLTEAVDGENFEWENMYPEFSKTAAEEGFTEIARLFDLVAKVESQHESKFRQLLTDVKNQKVFGGLSALQSAESLF